MSNKSKINVVLKTAGRSSHINQREVLNRRSKYELHLEDFNLDGLEVPMRVLTVHAPFIDSSHHMSKMISNYNADEWMGLFEFVESIGSGTGLVVHSDVDLSFVTEAPEGFYELMSDLNIVIHIENSPNYTAKPVPHKGPGMAVLIPSVCKYMNSRVGKRMFVPLLDTCHALMDIQSVIDIPEWTLKDYISNYKSSNYVIHLSYAVGMGDNIDNNHGATFRSNPALLDLIIKELYELDVEVSLVLEIIEDGGYDSPPGSLGMMIEELKESEKRTEIDLNW